MTDEVKDVKSALLAYGQGLHPNIEIAPARMNAEILRLQRSRPTIESEEIGGSRAAVLCPNI